MPRPSARHDPITDYYIDYSGDWLSLGWTGASRVLLTNTILLIFGTATIAFEGIRPLIAHLNWPPVSTSLRMARCRGGVKSRLGYDCQASQSPARIAVLFVMLRACHSGLALAARAISDPGASVSRRVPDPRRIGAVQERPAPGWYAPAAACALCVAIVANVEDSAVYQRMNHQTGYPYNTVPDHVAMWSSYQHVFPTCFAPHSDSHDVVASYWTPWSVSTLTARRSVPFVHRPLSLFYGDTRPATGTVEEFSNILRIYHAKYVVELPMPGFAEEKPFADLISSWRLRRQDDSVLVYEDDDRRFRIFEVLRPS